MGPWYSQQDGVIHVLLVLFLLMAQYHVPHVLPVTVLLQVESHVLYVLPVKLLLQADYVRYVLLALIMMSGTIWILVPEY